MVGEMKKNQIMQDLFGYQSEEEDEQDQVPERQHEGKTESGGEAEVNSGWKQKSVGSSRSSGSENYKDPAAVIRDVFRDSDSDEPGEYPVQNKIKTKNDKGKHAEDSQQVNVVAADYAVLEDKHAKTKSKGKVVGPSLVLEAPLRPPPVNLDQMAVFQLSNLIGIDPKPFDPSTFVEEDYYVADASGSSRRIPSANIIHWREVTDPDGTTSVQSNARFVTWSDGSLQLFIGNESFDVSDQDAMDIQSHLFLRHPKGIYQSQGRISRKMKFMPSSLSSDSHRRLTALVDSRHKKVTKVRQYIADVDPERVIEQQEKTAKEIIKSNKQLLNKKAKVTRKYIAKGRKDRQLSPGFLEDAIDERSTAANLSGLDLEKEAATERHIQKAKMQSTSMHLSGLDLEKEAAAERRSLKAKMVKDLLQSSSSRGKLTHGSSEYEMVEAAHGPEGRVTENIKEGENKELYEDSDFGSELPKGKDKGLASDHKKQLVFDEDSPPRRTTTRRKTMVYDSSEE